MTLSYPSIPKNSVASKKRVDNGDTGIPLVGADAWRGQGVPDDLLGQPTAKLTAASLYVKARKMISNAIFMPGQCACHMVDADNGSESVQCGRIAFHKGCLLMWILLEHAVETCLK